MIHLPCDDQKRTRSKTAGVFLGLLPLFDNWRRCGSWCVDIIFACRDFSLWDLFRSDGTWLAFRPFVFSFLFDSKSAAVLFIYKFSFRRLFQTCCLLLISCFGILLAGCWWTRATSWLIDPALSTFENICTAPPTTSSSQPRLLSPPDLPSVRPSLRSRIPPVPCRSKPRFTFPSRLLQIFLKRAHFAFCFVRSIIFISSRDVGLCNLDFKFMIKGRGQLKKKTFFFGLAPNLGGGGSTHARISWPSF